MEKYAMLRNCLSHMSSELVFREPRPATRGELAFAHSPVYVEQVFSGNLSAEQQKAIGFPWSMAMVERSVRSVGASIEAANMALQHGASVNLAGGTHHAAHDVGGGFCVFNDIVVAARVIQAQALAAKMPEPRVLVIDLDVHQGDGTARITASDNSIFTFSMHGEANYPFSKAVSDLDVALPTGSGDASYLSALEQALAKISSRFKADFIFYLAGLDVHEADRLGRLSLSDAAIAQRDELVLSFAASRKLPVAMAMGGGYFPDLNHLVKLQAETVLRLQKYAFQQA